MTPTMAQTPTVLAADTLTGDKVVNRQKEDLGKIDHLMIDLETGRIAYAVLSFGGFLGMGDKLFAIPWSALALRRWFYERDGRLCQEPGISFDAGKLRTGLEVIANQLGKRLDEDNPRLHAQLQDGSRLAAWKQALSHCRRHRLGQVEHHPPDALSGRRSRRQRHRLRSRLRVCETVLRCASRRHRAQSARRPDAVLEPVEGTPAQGRGEGPGRVAVSARRRDQSLLRRSSAENLRASAYLSADTR